VLKFIELVKQKSGGKIDVADFPGGTLGGDIANVSSLQGGTLDLIVLNAGLLVGVSKEFASRRLAVHVQRPEGSRRDRRGPDRQEAVRLAAAEGAGRPAYWELGFRNVTNSKRPLAKLEDFSGTEAARAAIAAVHRHLSRRSGAKPVPMAFPRSTRRSSRRWSTARRIRSR
jgi:TRAP-type C4-dicarboxylate transport system substrate-binding protein